MGDKQYQNGSQVAAQYHAVDSIPKGVDEENTSKMCWGISYKLEDKAGNPLVYLLIRTLWKYLAAN